MSAPVLKVNTFIIRHYVDSISKMFIIFNLVFGINRTSIIGNLKDNFIYASFAYSIMFNCVITVSTIYAFIALKYFLLLIIILKYVSCSVFSYTSRGKLMKFYKELQKFDKKIGYVTKINKSSTQIIIQMSLAFILTMLFSFLTSNGDSKLDMRLILFLTSIEIINAMEFYYLAHMMGLVSPRIRMITYHIKLYYSNNTYYNNSMVIYDKAFSKFKKEAKQKTCISMGDLMDLYYYIVKAYDFLNAAVKWELLILLMASFTASMYIAYIISMDIISGNFFVSEIFAAVSFAIPEILSLFAVCLFANKTCREVFKLRETLSSSLYQNSLEKTNKIAAQAFIGLTEAKDLSFSLFNMFNIDVDLPFHFLGLLFTYLIILLQFKKILTPYVV